MIRSAQVSVTSAATQLIPPDPDFQSATVKNTDAAAKVYLGDASVTTATGLELVAGAQITVTVNGPETLYAIAASGTVVVDVLRVGVG